MQETNTFWRKIPERFYSDLDRKPFERCLMCEASLLEEDRLYLIEKALKHYNEPQLESTVFEYAICLECADSFRNQLSEESRQNIDLFYQEKVDFESRFERLKDKAEEDWLNQCLIHHQEAGSQGEVQIYAFCRGDRCLFREFPYMIRAEAMEEITELISKETLDELDRFKDNLTSGPPELKELFDKAGPRMLI